ncbi:auxin-induced protein X15-like [Hibiscus syriacus]|uniref:auxin-induced protein X15-like n=1 Tax=Hibiscus syriacus TaxID=106335 RepID=UPI0019244F8B|nr:auxin-induced protein X15-like [Hibiscus syriacus]
MGIRLVHAKQKLQRILLTRAGNEPATVNVPKGHVAVYVGEGNDKKRFAIRISSLNHPLFRDLLDRAEEEFGFNHPMRGLTIPCSEECFIRITTILSS